MSLTEIIRHALAPWRRLIAAWAQGLPLFVLLMYLLCFTTGVEKGGELKDFAQIVVIMAFYTAVIFTIWGVRYRWTRYPVVAIVSVVFLIDAYCLFQHSSRFNVVMLRLILMTDPGESSEYLSQYLLTTNTLKAVAVTLLPVGAMLLLQRLWERRAYRSVALWCRHRVNSLNRLVALGLKLCSVIALLTLFASSAIFDLTSAADTYRLATFGIGFVVALGIFVAVAIVHALIARRGGMKKHRVGIVGALSIALIICGLDPYLIARSDAIGSNTSLQAIQAAYNVYKNNTLDLTQLTKVNREIVIDEVGSERFKIVVIIGESFNKHHAPQYGYHINTMPRLTAEPDSNIYVFTNAITPYPRTAEAMLDIMSTKALTDTGRWEDSPLFPAIMHKAGLSVALADNQYKKNSGKQNDYSCSYFFSTDEMSRLCFDMRNDDKWAYDGDMLANCLDYYSSCDLLIVHFIGQHIQANKRYPSEFDRLKASDYGYRTDLNDSKKATLAQYDNATLYQDYCIASIIDKYRADDAVIIFFPDHGEEVYDFRDQYGRRIEQVTAETARCLYEVPYFVWVSDSFRANHAEKAAAIARAVNYPIRNTDLSHVLIDLADIKTASFNPQLSWLNDNYDQRLKRELNTGQDYDEVAKQ